jgi:hypothetical protein
VQPLFLGLDLTILISTVELNLRAALAGILHKIISFLISERWRRREYHLCRYLFIHNQSCLQVCKK